MRFGGLLFGQVQKGLSVTFLNNESGETSKSIRSFRGKQWRLQATCREQPLLVLYEARLMAIVKHHSSQARLIVVCERKRQIERELAG
jgi:hypothetical protein